MTYRQIALFIVLLTSWLSFVAAAWLTQFGLRIHPVYAGFWLAVFIIAAGTTEGGKRR